MENLQAGTSISIAMAPLYPFHPLLLILGQASALALEQSKIAMNPKPIGGTYVPSCTNLNAAYSRRCWGALNLTDFLTNPVHGWNATTPTCTDPSTSGVSCCEPTEGWATCFLRIASGVDDACYNVCISGSKSCICVLSVRKEGFIFPFVGSKTT